MCDLVLCSSDSLMFWELNTQRNEVVHIQEPLQHWEEEGGERAGNALESVDDSDKICT